MGSAKEEYYLDLLTGLPGKGPIPAKYVIVGIAPSTKRPAGRKLEPFGASSWRFIQTVRREFPDIYITNLIKTPLAPRSKVGVTLIRQNLPVLLEELRIVKPERVLTFGTAPAQALCPGFKKLREDRGTFFRHPDGFLVIPTYHPAAVMRDPDRGKAVSRDLHRFFSITPEFAKYEILPHEAIQAFLFPQDALVSVDIETPSLTDFTITMLGFRVFQTETVYIIQRPTPEILRQFTSSLKQQHCTIVGHNLTFDLRVIFESIGYDMPRLPVEDTILLSHIAGEQGLSLKNLTTLYTDLPGSRAGGSFADPQYLAEDVRSVEALYYHFVEYRERFAYKLLRDLTPSVAAMQFRGVHIDRQLLEEQRIKTASEVAQCLMQLNADGGDEVNWQSPIQVVEFLARAGVRLVEKTKTGRFSVKESVLLELEHPAAKLILQIRERKKLLSTYYEGYGRLMDARGNLHPRLRLTGTKTGRLSCSDPNLQNVPRQGPLKLCFVSRWKGGHYGLLDLSQAELRVAALLSNDTVMAGALLAEDPHRRIASMVFGLPEDEIDATMRKASKAVTFGLLYGGTVTGLAKRAGLPEERIAEVMEEIFEKFSALRKWLKEMWTAVDEGSLTTLFGRTRTLIPEQFYEGDRGAYRKAINTPVQSTASDIALWILFQTVEGIRRERVKSRVLFGVHDSILIEIAPGEEEVMASLVQLSFMSLKETPLTTLPLYYSLPIMGELIIGNSWAETESTNESYKPIKFYPCSNLPQYLKKEPK
jgi:DNA polymerase-1